MKLIFKFTSKILMVLLVAIAVSIPANSQIKDPVKWSYAIKKLKAKIYELRIRANIEPGWHIYAQKQSADAIAIPTSFKFDQVPGLMLMGIPKEIGNKELHVIKELGISNAEYAGNVDFIQKISIKGKIDQIKARITYQACTRQECLPEKTIEIGIPVK